MRATRYRGGHPLVSAGLISTTIKQFPSKILRHRRRCSQAESLPRPPTARGCGPLQKLRWLVTARPPARGGPGVQLVMRMRPRAHAQTTL